MLIFYFARGLSVPLFVHLWTRFGGKSATDGNSLADAEAREDVREQIVGRAPAGNLLERRSRLLQIGQHEFLRKPVTVRACRGAGTNECLMRSFDEHDVTDVRDFGAIGQRLDIKGFRDAPAKRVEADARR